ncbi:unnamed protein product [Coffea canephora]|uniref:DH200=94 genomic scaffold, scaffold_230 n=1 Tax=Coffea canephora TaxID=49390 RepID=A0A068VC89_COFCA|nr:unnamed protein product [Coffea canephora]
MDGDNKMFPLALLVVGVENYDNLSWSLGLLVQDLKISDSSTWCIMIDKQKQMHKGLALKERLWRYARASYITQLKIEIEMMKQESKDAYAWLDEKDPNTWSRAHIKTGLDCDILVNNMCESFNSIILKTGSLPIVGMLQTIYLYVLKRMEKNRETMSSMKVKLLTYYFLSQFLKLHYAKKEQCMCICYYASTMKYQICCPFSDQFAVDLGSKTCTCRKWQLRGIPSPTYWKSTYMKSYEPMLNPINGPNLWAQVDLPPIRPPKYGKSPERPKKLKKKGPDEDRNKQLYVNPSKPHKVSKVGTKMSCSLCKKYEHNRRSCPKKTSKLLQ